MRKVVASEMVSLDGHFAGPEGEIDWFAWDSDSEKYAIDLVETVDAILFGRVTYEMMAGYWPTATPPADSPIIIDRMNNLPKVVFSKTLTSAGWNNSRIVSGNIAEEISRLKQQRGKNLVIYGSGSIVSALMNLGLIDEMHLIVNPIVLGSGRPLFRNIEYRHRMDLVAAKPFRSGAVALHYAKGPG